MDTSRRSLLAGGAGALLLAGTTSAALTESATAAGPSLSWRIFNRAASRSGRWYRYNAAGPNYFDAAGLVKWAAYGEARIVLPHSIYGLSRHPRIKPVTGFYNSDNKHFGSNIGKDRNIRQGDLLFFSKTKTSRPAHVGFHVGWWPMPQPMAREVRFNEMVDVRIAQRVAWGRSVESLHKQLPYVRAYRIR